VKSGELKPGESLGAIGMRRIPLFAATVATAVAAMLPANIALAQGEAAADQLARSDALEEIIVTARKRAESLQDTPIAVTAFTAEALEARGIGSTKDLGTFTPNLVSNNGSAVSGNNSAASYFIRGIGQIDFLLNTDPGVGLYIDDVYMARSMGAAIDLLDLERIEVLRGPQGTLFGRNTIGGAISLTSQAPATEQRLQAEASVGSRDLMSGRISADLPFGQRVLTKLAVSFKKEDGYVHRLTDNADLGDVDARAARGVIRWLPTDAWQLDLVLDGSRRREESQPTVAVALNGASQFGGFYNAVLSGSPNCVPPPGSFTDPACFNAQFLTGDRYSTYSSIASRSDLDAWGSALTVSWNRGSLTAKSITAYRHTDAVGFRDGDNTPLVIHQTSDTWEHEQFSQELQLAGKAARGALDWIVGLYYFKEDGVNLSQVNFAPALFQSGGSVSNDSAAAFGQATWRMTGHWSLTAGLRYTDETKRFTPDQFIITDRGLGLPPGTPLLPHVEARTSVSELSPMVNLAYRPSESFMGYLTYSEGFKSGGFTQRVFPPLAQVPSFDPEFVKSYEAGAKITGLDGRMRLNTAVFFTDYTDLQVQELVGVAPITQNTAAAQISGFEVELTARLASAWLFESGVGYTKARYMEIGPRVVGITRDNKFAQVPEWTANAGLAYTAAFDGGATFIPRVDWSYRSAVFMDAINTPEIRQPGYGLLSASLTLESANQRWRAMLAGRNLTNERYFTSGYADLPISGIAEVLMARRREWSLTLHHQF